jgi:hypothetical protein
VTGPVWALSLRRPEVFGLMRSLTVAALPWERMRAMIPDPANVAAGTSAEDSPPWRGVDWSTADPPNSG